MAYRRHHWQGVSFWCQYIQSGDQVRIFVGNITRVK
jgi:hypothetical protein